MMCKKDLDLKVQECGAAYGIDIYSDHELLSLVLGISPERLTGGIQEILDFPAKIQGIGKRKELAVFAVKELPGRDTFRILAVQIRAKDGLRELTFRALRALLEAARERYGAHLCEWIYEWPAGKRDPHPSILARLGLPWLGTPTREVAGQRVFAASEKLSEPSLLHNRPCLSRESMARQGFADIPFASLEQGTLAGIRELLDSPTEDTEGLSPFVEAGEYDPELSFVSIDAKTVEVAGWVVCRPYGKYIELRRLYVARRFRRRRLGQFLGALVIRLIQEKSEGLVLLACRERSSMQKIIRGYLRDTIVATHDLCRVTAEARS